jgi:hypothetical protein
MARLLIVAGVLLLIGALAAWLEWSSRNFYSGRW